MATFLGTIPLIAQCYRHHRPQQLERQPLTRSKSCYLYCLLFLASSLLPIQVVKAEQTTHNNILRLSAANSLFDSGVLNVLVEDFSRRFPDINVKVSIAGALEVLKYGRDGKADIIISHHPLDERRFVTQGYGRIRTQIIYSEFALFGPPDEIPELSRAADIVAALKMIAEEEAAFLVPSARSGVFTIIESLWANAGINTDWIDYENTGVSGASNLLLASQAGAFTIMDLGTYIAKRKDYGYKILPLIRGDFALRNIYSVLIVSPDKVKGANEELAQIFYDYIIGEKGQGAISRYGENKLNISYMTPAADFDPDLREKRAQEYALHFKRKSELMTLIILAGIFLILIVLLYTAKRRADAKRLNSENYAQECVAKREIAQQANDTKSSFLANMSHELRTPLNAIIGYSELLEEEAKDIGQISFVKDLKYIDKAAHHLLALINDILDLSKVEAGKIELNPQIVNIQSLVQEVCSTIQPQAERSGNVINFTVATYINNCVIDDTKLIQILLNLLSNACKFTSNGEVSLHVNCDSKQQIIFEVRDTGIGLTKTQQSKVFDAFVQADRATTKKYGGTGLGLAICKRFCYIMDGQISVKSKVGKGTVFTVTLPYSTDSSERLSLAS